MVGFLGSLTQRYLGGMKTRFGSGFRRDLGAQTAGQLVGRNQSDTVNQESGGSDSDVKLSGLSSLLDKEFSRIEGVLPTGDSLISQPLENISEIVGDNIPVIIGQLNSNIKLVDSKVQQLGRNIDKQKSLMTYTKKMLDRTNSLIENQVRASSHNRFKSIENRMESAQLSSLIDKQVASEVARHIAGLEERLAESEKGGGLGGLIAGALGIGAGGVGAGVGAGMMGKAAAKGAGVGARVGGAAAKTGGALMKGAGAVGRIASRFAGPVGVAMIAGDALFGELGTGDEFNGGDAEYMSGLEASEKRFLESVLGKVERGETLNVNEQAVYDMHKGGKAWGFTPASGSSRKPMPIRAQTEDYSNLMGQLDGAKGGAKNFFGEYDLYDLVVKKYFLSTDGFALSSKAEGDITTGGTMTISSKQKIILHAPEIEIVGKLLIKEYTPSSAGSSAPDGQGGSDVVGGSTTPAFPGGYNPGDSFPGGTIPGSMGGSSMGAGSSGGSVGDGSVVPNTVEGGDGVSEAFRYFKSQGWTDDQAAAIVGNLMQESGPNLNGQAVGDNGQAFGKAQWNRAGSPDRYANFEKLYGKDLTQASDAEQLAFIQWELTSKDPSNAMQKKAGDRLREAKTLEEGTLIVSQGYERPNPNYAHNSRRVGYAQQVVGNSEAYMAEDAENPIVDQQTAEVFSGDAPEGFTTGAAPLKMTNKGATRNDPLQDDLQGKLQEAVYTTYGPGYSVEVYSGGQEAKGEGGKRTGSTRHDHGGAADVYIIGPDGKRVVGDDLGKIGQYWTAKKYGGVGLQMKGGGIHLDVHDDRAPTWNYGGGETRAAKEMVNAGIAGKLPEGLHYVEDPSVFKEVEVKTAAEESNPYEDTAFAKKKDEPAASSESLEKKVIGDSLVPRAGDTRPTEEPISITVRGGADVKQVSSANSSGEAIVSAAQEKTPTKVASVQTAPTPPKKATSRPNSHDRKNMSASDLISEVSQIA